MSDVQTPPQEKLLDHAYDGIQEYDNPTPGWWTAIFVFTVIFSAVYSVYYHFSPVSSNVAQTYDEAMGEDLLKQFGKMGTLRQDGASILAYMQKPDYLAAGASVFKGNCVSCHGGQGQGLIGPNMTDDYYKNIKTLDDFPRVINGGAASGAMPSWQNRLHPNQVALVAAYVASLRGQNLPGQPPYGVKIDPWPTAAATSTAPASQP